MKKTKKKTLLPTVIVTRDKENDLFLTLNENYLGFFVCETVEKAIGCAKENKISAMMILADNYPEKTVEISESEAKEIKDLGLRVYIEYPSLCEELGIVGYDGDACMGYSRGVAVSDTLGMEKNSIFYFHGAKYRVKSDISQALVVSARVAGYDIADYGVDDANPQVLLEYNSDKTLLIATTKLSQFISARYAPYKRMGALWSFILSFLTEKTGDEKIPMPEWTPASRAHYGKKEKLPKNSYKDAVILNSDWYINSGMLDGDFGTGGIFEGFCSGKNFDEFGKQKKRCVLRADCNGESVGALALAYKLTKNKDYEKAAYNAMKWLLTESLLTTGERADKKNSQYGLFSWHNFCYDQYYGDDNAKSIIGLLLAAESLGTTEFDLRILEAITANFRTTGTNGFRGARIMAEDLDKNGWRYYYGYPTEYYSAHFEALAWACYLWAYDRTGYEPFLSRTQNGIKMMMQAYENTMSREYQDKEKQWEWSNGMQQERAKMILPLAFLVRVCPTDESVSYLDRMISDLVLWQDSECGALADAYGEEWQGNGLYGPFKKNGDYGNHEAPVIQKNGDPCSDSLYTASFAMLSLYEAQKSMEAIKNKRLAKKYKRYTKLLSDYHVRIQQICEKYPEYNGVWYRGFDFEKWETYGSDGDAGWGVWCIETGWSQSWISSALSLQELGVSMWDYTRTTSVKDHIEKVVREMIDEKFNK